MNTPLCIPNLGREEEEVVIEVLRSGWLAHGPYNKKLEESFVNMIGCKHAIAMNSCTSALEVAIKVSGIKGNVLVPSFTWVASANSIVTSGANPVLVDVDFATRNTTVENLEAGVDSKTEAVMIVHYGGQPCNMTEIVAFCNKHNLLLIEDSAETLGATWEGKQVGSFGLGCFSFFPTKNITTGEGGMLTLQDDSLLVKAKAIMAHGVSSTTHDRETIQKPWERSAIMAGHNYRLSNILAAIGYVQFKKLDQMNLNRQQIANRYNVLLNSSGLPIQTPKVVNGATHVYQMYTITVPKELRDDLVMYLRSKEIGASVHFYPAVHQQPFYKEGFRRTDLSNTEKLVNELITLPIYPTMSFEQVEFVVEQIHNFFRLK